MRTTTLIATVVPLGRRGHYSVYLGDRMLLSASEELASEFQESEIKVPKNLRNRVRAVLKRHPDLRWDDAIQIVLDETQLDNVRAEKRKAKMKSGDFTDADECDDD
jgi:hypothetical protein